MTFLYPVVLVIYWKREILQQNSVLRDVFSLTLLLEFLFVVHYKD